ncbi:AraC family transcriptional regulator [Gammaproteobacteria bacterium 45_16_T64]|nr:AraC family transcriptional regulator [Gammaproteobacteria bacterium 45_16_T64]
MNYIEQVQRGIDFFERSMDEDISSEEIARAAGISRWHFQRIFKALTNETLKTYMRSRRLANALEKLLLTDTRIIDIAIAAGYESQESFARAFKQAFGMTPSDYRRIGDKNMFLKKIQFDKHYLTHINTNVSLEPEIYTQKELLLVGIKTDFYGVDSDKNNIGNKLPKLWEEFLDRYKEIRHAMRGTCYGIIKQCHTDSEQLFYYATMAVSEYGVIPEGMDIITIPSATYAKFTHRGEVKYINNTVNYIYSNWLMGAGKVHTYGVDIEIYGPDHDADSANSEMHYAIPIK